MKITRNPLLMLRTPSSLSLNTLLVINGVLFKREAKTPSHFAALGWFLPGFSLSTQQLLA